MKIREFFVEATLKYDTKAWGKFDGAVSDVGRNLKNIAGAVAAASAALLGVTKAASTNARELDLNSQALGINVEKLQELEFAAKDVANVSRGELQGALEGLSQSLISASTSASDSSPFLALGINLEELRKRGFKSDQVLGLVADRFSMIRDPILKASVAQEIFGSTGTKLIPLLNKGSRGLANSGIEARKLGLILGKDAISAGVKFDRQFNRTVAVLKNLAFTVGTELFSVVGPVISQFQEFVVKNKDLIATGIVVFAKDLAKFLKGVFIISQKVVNVVTQMIDNFGGFEEVVGTISTAFGFILTGKLLFSVLKLASAIKGLLTFGAISNPLGWITIAALAVVRLIKKWDDLVARFKSAKGFLGTVGGVIGEFFGKGDAGESAGSGLGDKISSFFKSDSPATSAVSGNVLAANSKPAAISTSTVSNNSTNLAEAKIHAPITINIANGGDVGEVARSVKKGVSEAFGDQLRNAFNQNIGEAVR